MTPHRNSSKFEKGGTFHQPEIQRRDRATDSGVRGGGEQWAVEDAWLVHGNDALLHHHQGHAGDPVFARELTELAELAPLVARLRLGAGSAGGWARSAWGSVMRGPSDV